MLGTISAFAYRHRESKKTCVESQPQHTWRNKNTLDSKICPKHSTSLAFTSQCVSQTRCLVHSPFTHMQNFQLHNSFSVFLHFLFQFLLIISNLYLQVVHNFIRNRFKAPVRMKEPDLMPKSVLFWIVIQLIVLIHYCSFRTTSRSRKISFYSHRTRENHFRTRP